MKVLVCGGRDFLDRQLAYRTLDEHAAGALIIIHGDARGADQLAGDWARLRGKVIVACPADWNTYGKGAGPIRNQQMLDKKPDVVVAFPGGHGTQDMVMRALRAGVRVVEVLA